MTGKTKFIVILLLVLVTLGCKRIDKGENPTIPTAGKGGNAKLKITAKHHGNIIDSVTVYIKYNESNTPSSYDDSAQSVPDIDGIPTVIFDQLKKGSYYLFARGWDTTISNNVIGGIPYTIKEEIPYDITVPVTEGD